MVAARAGADPTLMPDPGRSVSWRIEVDSASEPISGRVQEGDGREERFIGWSQLFALLMRLAEATSARGRDGCT